MSGGERAGGDFGVFLVAGVVVGGDSLFGVNILLVTAALKAAKYSFKRSRGGPRVMISPTRGAVRCCVTNGIARKAATLSNMRIGTNRMATAASTRKTCGLAISDGGICAIAFDGRKCVDVSGTATAVTSGTTGHDVIDLDIGLDGGTPRGRIGTSTRRRIIMASGKSDGVSRTRTTMVVPPGTVRAAAAMDIAPCRRPTTIAAAMAPKGGIRAPMTVTGVRIRATRRIALTGPMALTVVGGTSRRAAFRGIRICGRGAAAETKRG